MPIQARSNTRITPIVTVFFMSITLFQNAGYLKNQDKHIQMFLNSFIVI